ncbi:MAG: CBS domain-containing protein [Bacteroidota bacterium]
MTAQITFYLSQILGKRIHYKDGSSLGRIRDFLIDITLVPGMETEPVRPQIVLVKVKTRDGIKYYDFTFFDVKKYNRRPRIKCKQAAEVSLEKYPHSLWLKEDIQDKQLVDINGRKLVRVNDIRLVMIPAGTYAIAVDVGIDGLLRRIGIDRLIQALLDPFGLDIPSKMILWDDIAAVDVSNANIRLSKSSTKLNTLHPSDLADIMEDLDKASRTAMFASLDEEKAADVLEELEPHAQIHIVESLPVEKVADVLEKMPADEVADLLDAIEEDKAEKLLEEMEKESSEEVRELLGYPGNHVGSLMTTDFYTFNENLTVGETLDELRRLQPEPAHIYSIFIVDNQEHFRSAISLGELVIAPQSKKLSEIMKNTVSVYDDDKVDTLAEIVSRYNLLAVPVINKEKTMEGMVVVEDIVDDLLNRRKTK